MYGNIRIDKIISQSARDSRRLRNTRDHVFRVVKKNYDLMYEIVMDHIITVFNKTIIISHIDSQFLAHVYTQIFVPVTIP